MMNPCRVVAMLLALAGGCGDDGPAAPKAATSIVISDFEYVPETAELRYSFMLGTNMLEPVPAPGAVLAVVREGGAEICRFGPVAIAASSYGPDGRARVTTRGGPCPPYTSLTVNRTVMVTFTKQDGTTLQDEEGAPRSLIQLVQVAQAAPVA